MARFQVGQEENYGGSGGAGYFSLKNHKDVARVRFLYNGIEDVEGFAVHQVEMPDGKKRYVNCIREYNEPIDNCPFCSAKMPQYAKFFIPLYNIDEGKAQVWDRGKKFGHKISSICTRYSNLVSHTFEIERNGKAGDTATTYEIFETGQDNTTMEDIEEIPNILGGVVLDKSFDEMNYWLDNGEFPDSEISNNDDVRRRPSSDDTEPPFRGGRTPQEPIRRTPVSRGDKF